jgi:anthranilate phosphoribosyltransferase
MSRLHLRCLTMIQPALQRLIEGENLSEEHASDAMQALMSGEASPALAAAFLTALRLKGETAAEIAALARVMRAHAVCIEPSAEVFVDTCGTGGGGVTTFNISTAAAFVVAGAGLPVAKHGNRAMTSKTGSADVLEALGVRIDLEPDAIRRCIEEVGVGFLFAQRHHPAMRHVGPIRKELPFRTVFNCLGPLCSPAGAPYQVVGVYEERLVPLLAEALRELGTRRSLVVHGHDGLDELSTLGPTLVSEASPEGVREYVITPAELGLRTVTAEDLAPGDDAAGNAAIIRAILSGEVGPRRDIVLLNAAAALYVAGRATTLVEGIAMAAESIDSGRAAATLARLIEVTNA